MDERGSTVELPPGSTSGVPPPSRLVRAATPQRFASAPEAARDLAGILIRARPLLRGYRGGLESDLRERVTVAVSQVNACSACTQMHQRWALRSGVSSAELEALGAGDLADLDPRSRAAIVYAVDLAERRFRGPASPEVAQLTRQHLSIRELSEVEAIARAVALANLTLGTFSRSWSPGAGNAHHPVFARVWARVASRVGSDEQRGELLAGLRGRVLEVGAGDGRNFAHYPPEVSDVLAVEPEPYLRRIACRAARRAPVPIKAVAGTAEAVPVDDGTCDAVVASLVLCSVVDQQTALAELRRVLVTGGELRFYEHVVAGQGLASVIQIRLDDWGIWPRIGGGCHLSRDTVGAIAAAGFTVERLRRFTSGPGRLGIPFVLGAARCVP